MISKIPSKPNSRYIDPYAQRQNERKFCQRQEFLLFVDQYDCQYVHEADLRPCGLSDAVQDCEDSTIQIIRMDQSNWCGVDVTEDVAAAWLNFHKPGLEIECSLPEFVADSEAWRQYCDDFQATYGTLGYDEFSNL